MTEYSISQFWKVTKLLYETEAKVDRHASKFLYDNYNCASQHSPRFHVEVCLPFRNCEMDYYSTHKLL